MNEINGPRQTAMSIGARAHFKDQPKNSKYSKIIISAHSIGKQICLHNLRPFILEKKTILSMLMLSPENRVVTLNSHNSLVR